MNHNPMMQRTWRDRTLAVACLAFLVTGSISAQQLPGDSQGDQKLAADLATATTSLDRASWTQLGTVLSGVALPDGMPGMDGKIPVISSGFERNGNDLLSVRRRDLSIREGTPAQLTGYVQLDVLVATSEKAAQDALLAHVGQPHSVAIDGHPEQNLWSREPQGMSSAIWQNLGNVRMGVGMAPNLGAIAFVRANVLVRINATGSGLASTLAVAQAVDALIKQSPLHAADSPSVRGLSLASDRAVVQRDVVPLTLTGAPQGAGLSLEFDVTGGGVLPGQAGGYAYYAGDAGEQTIKVHAMDSFGFPSEATLVVQVREGD